MTIPPTPDPESNGKHKPKRHEIDVKQYPLSAIMTKIFEGAIFKSDAFLRRNTKSAKDKAVYIEELARKHSIDLNAATLTKNLFRPWAHRTTAILSSAYLMRLYAFLDATADQFGFRDHLPLMQELIDMYSDRNKNSDEPPSPPNPPAPSNKILAWLAVEHNWYFYERIGDDDTYQNARFGISVGEIIFRPESSELKATLKITSRHFPHVYEGQVFCDGVYLYIKAAVEDGHTAFLSLKLSGQLKARQSIMVGHYTYHSIHYEHLLTKAVIIQKKLPTLPAITLGDYHYHDPVQYNLLDEAIRRFLYLRSKNRLSLPRTEVSSLEDLKSVLDELNSLNTDNIVPNFAGDYFVYYRRGDGRIWEDTLCILPNHEKRYCESTYTHKPDHLGHYAKTYKGRTFANGRIIATQLQQYLLNKRDPEDPILLAFQIPDESIEFDDCQCMTGTLSGLQDNDRIPVSYNCLLVRRSANLTDFHGKEDPRVAAYFESLPIARLAASPPKFRLEDLG